MYSAVLVSSAAAANDFGELTRLTTGFDAWVRSGQNRIRNQSAATFWHDGNRTPGQAYELKHTQPPDVWLWQRQERVQKTDRGKVRAENRRPSCPEL